MVDTTHVTKSIDTAINITLKMQKEYMEILNKTNSQLSLWWNPYGVMIASLGVLFTILAIVAAIIIWTQSSYFKSLIKSTIKKYDAILEAFMTEKKQQLESIDQQLDVSIAKFKEDLSVAAADKKAEIEAIIKDLENKKKFIEVEKKNPIVKPFTISSNSLSGIYPSQTFHKCSHCKFGYLIDDPKDPLYGLSGYSGISKSATSAYYGTGTSIFGPTGPTGPFIPGSSTKVTQCPKCGNIEEL